MTEEPLAANTDGVAGEGRYALAESLLLEAELLLASNTPRSALLVAGAAAEAAMRAAALHLGAPATPLRTKELVQSLRGQGVLTDADAPRLMEYFALRNAVSHGIVPEAGLSPDAGFSQTAGLNAARGLAAITRRLIDARPDVEPGPGGWSFGVLTGAGINRDEELRTLTARANKWLREVVGSADGFNLAEWNLAEDASGEATVTLSISDPGGSATASFRRAELRDPPHMRLRLRRLWGELLQARSQRQLERLLGAAAGEGNV